jgi:hypothetical protein
MGGVVVSAGGLVIGAVVVSPEVVVAGGAVAVIAAVVCSGCSRLDSSGSRNVVVVSSPVTAFSSMDSSDCEVLSPFKALFKKPSLSAVLLSSFFSQEHKLTAKANTNVKTTIFFTISPLTRTL